MQIQLSQNTSKNTKVMNINSLLASIMFFTRIPLWRVINIPSESFKNVVPFWSLTGVITGGVSAFLAWSLIGHIPIVVLAVVILCVRMLLTGALHEDGLADFFDGFGGGRDREHILKIMKDSHIGSFGVISIVAYFFVYVAVVSTLPVYIIPSVVLCVDMWSKSVSANIVNLLPYARTENESKNKVTYNTMTIYQFIFSIAIGFLPMIFLGSSYLLCTLTPVLFLFAFSYYINKKIDGYTGDCCGALFILCEISFLLSISFFCHSF